jgi:Fic family protein
MQLHLEQLERLSAEWKRLQPLSAAHDERLWLKLRLEWNYHSNHIEGNTLTYPETEFLMLHDKAAGGHDLRDYEEMKAHNVAIAYVRKLAVSPQELTEADVRDLNQIILKEPFYKKGITPDEKSAPKLITPGCYKEQPNSVRTPTGEPFEYADPIDVAPRMAKLVQAVRDCVKWEGLTLLAGLAKTHHEFTLIHPFDDGNGRVARLVTNYVLLKKGLLPLVVRADKKTEYLSALRQADSGDLASLTNFFADQLIWSLELGIKAGTGEKLEEPLDVEKEIELFVREQNSQKKPALKKSPEIVHQFLTATIRLLFEKIDEKSKKIGEIFESRQLLFSSNVGSRGGSWREQLDFMDAHRSSGLPDNIHLSLSLKGYLGKAAHPFGTDIQMTVHLHDYEYSIEIHRQLIHHAIYAEPLTNEAADKIVSDFLMKLLQQIKQQAQQ